MYLSTESLKSGTVIIKDFDFCLSLLNKEHPKPKKFNGHSLDDLPQEAISHKTYYNFLRHKFYDECCYKESDLTGFTLIASQAAYPDASSYYSILCQTIAEEIASTSRWKFRKAAPFIESALCQLINYIILKRPDHLFAESALAAFHAGGMLCSWEGGFPDGNPVVFWPHRQEPQFEDNPVYPWHGDYPPAIAD